MRPSRGRTICFPPVRIDESHNAEERYSSAEVQFRVKLKPGADVNTVKSELECMAGDIEVYVSDFRNLKRQLVEGKTSQTTYEDLFEAELCYVTKTITNHRGPYTVQEWVEKKPATVPESLTALVDSIYIKPNLYSFD